MKGYPFVYFLAMAFGAVSFSASATPLSDKKAGAITPSCTLSATQISGEIQRRGVREMMRGLPSENYKGYFELVSCIWTGKKEWLDIAVPVITETHPDSEDDLTDAVQNALVVNPETTLSEPWPNFFTLRDYICSLSVDDFSNPSLDDQSNYQSAMAELDRRIEILKRVKNLGLQSKVKECLADLDDTKKQFGHFFQIHN